jgi:hypothetical protein
MFIIHQGSTTISAFGISPIISGAYSASTRVGGKWNEPLWLRRRVYSTVQAP